MGATVVDPIIILIHTPYVVICYLESLLYLGTEDGNTGGCLEVDKNYKHVSIHHSQHDSIMTFMYSRTNIHHNV